MKRLCGIACGFVLASLTGAAAADDAAAESLFQEGFRFKTQHNWEEACKRFARSEELAPGVGTLLNLGECHEQLHELAQAWLAYRQAITVADANSDRQRGERARHEAARLEPRVPHLTITTAHDDVVVTRDGARVEAAALNAAVALDPGRHVITASAAARTTWQKTIDVAEGDAVTVTVPELAGVTPTTRRGSPQRAVGIAMEIGGGAIVGAGFVFGAIALGQWHSVEHACPNAGCPRATASARQHDVDVARTWANIGTAAIIGGAAILGAGIALHLTGPKDDVAIAPTLGGIALRWTR